MKWVLLGLLSYLTFVSCDTTISKKAMAYAYANSDSQQNPSLEAFPTRQDVVQKSHTHGFLGTPPKIQPVPEEPQFEHYLLPNASNVIASVREYPSEIHRCSATFISKEVLLTTARCIFGRFPHNTFVHALSEFLVDGGLTISVQRMVTHPNFEASPPINDVGIIFLKVSVPSAPVFQLPVPELEVQGQPINYFGWKFSQDQKQYYLQKNDATVISGAKCSLILSEYVDCEFMCAGADKMDPNEMINMGTFDQGVPLVYQKYVVGIYNRPGLDRRVMAEKFSKVMTHVAWIKSQLSRNFTFTTPLRRYNLRRNPERA